MSDDHHKRTAASTQHVQTSPYQLRADALPLTIGKDGHRRQSHSNDTPPRALDNNWCEENVTDNDIVYGHQRERVSAGLSKFLDEVRFRRLRERKLGDMSNTGNVFRSLGTDGNHAFSDAAHKKVQPQRLSALAVSPSLALASNARHTDRMPHTTIATTIQNATGDHVRMK